MAAGLIRAPVWVCLLLSCIVSVFAQCPVNQFYCSSSSTGGYCIPQVEVCDSIIQCHDGADEMNCNPMPDCQTEFERCPGVGNSACLYPTWRCDEYNDCGDWSDEDPSWCRNTACPADLVKCTVSNQCIHGRFLCNGVDDCGDGSNADEPQGYCNSTDFTCPVHHFKCNNGHCIPEHWICDTDNDCGDGSDEAPMHDCSMITCRPGYFRCKQNKPGLSPCIPEGFVCDGLAHCEEADDELPPTCPEPVGSCDTGYYRCNNGLCIHRSWECDRDNDCGDGSDEGSTCDYGTCSPATEITCGNGRCVRRENVCDGRDDCRDMSDESETLCGTTAPTCTGGTILCRNECVMPENCDIDQCTLFPSVCSQVCTDLGRGTYRCSCRPGYDLQQDGISCLAKSAETPYLLFCNKFYLRESNVYAVASGDNGVAIARDFSFLVAFDFDYVNQRLYLTDVTAHSIISMKMDGSDRKEIVSQYAYDVEGIGLDWVSRKLFWTERYFDVLEVAELDGSNRKTLVRENLFEPRAVAVDPRHGFVYWTDWGLNAYIGRVGMDGTNETELHNKDIVWPNGITVDYPADKIYWTDAHLDYLAYADLDFSNVHHVINDNSAHTIAHPFSVSVFEDVMYWTDWNLFKVYSANKRDGSNIQEVLTELVHRPMDIHVLHPLKQDPSLTNPCGNDNGGCSHLCLIKAGGGAYQCACPDNYILGEDGKTCTSDCINTQFLCESNSRCIPFYWQCDGENDCSDGADEEDCPHRHCDPGYFQCKGTFTCVHPNLLCNGEDDCNDNSDEAHCAEAECQDWEFRCDNGKCIQHVAVCDQSDDCGDNSDEMSDTCGDHQCYDGYFQCDNGFCIPEAWWCDLDNDCGDHSDEPVRQCERRSCPTGWFSCETNYRCIPGWAVCYGGDHCRDNSDEKNCNVLTCDPLGEFRCNSHQCIPTRWYCDNQNDCPDGSDEPFGCVTRDCSESEFQCLDDRCIPGAWHCDGDFDCGGTDETDELNCHSIACPDDQFKCTSTGYCIDNALVCDGRAACDDASDEVGCATRYPGGLWCPEEDFFTCDNTVCIPKWWVCDGEDDCLDNSDESIDNCDVVGAQCNKEHSRWRCEDDETCILEWERCDDIIQCPDGSDEKSCDTNRPCDPDTEFACGDGRCIPLESVCNLQNDCPNELDEKDCGSGSCDVDNGGCQHSCVSTDGGYYCKCWDTYSPDPSNPKQCLDIDECIDHPCPQTCRNLQPRRQGDPGYTCACAEGFRDYSMEQDGTICEIDGTQFILIGAGKDIVKYYPKEARFADFIGNEAQVEGIDYHTATERVFFIDRIQRAMKEVPQDATSDTKVNNLGIDDLYSPVGIAMDWVANNIYFTDHGEMGRETGRSRRAAADVRPKVGVLSPTGNIHHWREAVIIADRLERPTGVAVNPDKGLLYWTDLGSTTASTPKIEMSWMNGRNRQDIVYSGFVQPSGLSIDFNSNQTVYFCDQKADIIGYFGWDGWNVRVLARSDVLAAPLSWAARANPYQLDVFESYIYWTTGRPGVNYVMFMGKNTTQFPVEPLFNTPVNTLGGIKVYHERRYLSDIPNPCATAKCTDMCVLTPRNAENEVFQGFDCICGGTALEDEQIEDCNNENPIIPTTRIETTVTSTEQPTSVKSTTEQTMSPILTSEEQTVSPVKPTQKTTTGTIEPTKGKTTTKPQPTKAPCRCVNGGVCKGDGSCVCSGSFSGDFCEIGSPNAPGKNTGSTSGAAIGAAVGVATLIILLLVLVVLVLLCYVKKKKGSGDRPVTYRTGANVEIPGAVSPPMNGEPLYETGLPHTPVTFENPGFGAGAAGGGDPEKTGLPPEFGDILPEKVDMSAPRADPGNPYTNMPIGVDPYTQTVNPPEPPPAYSAEDLDDVKK